MIRIRTKIGDRWWVELPSVLPDNPPGSFTDYGTRKTILISCLADDSGGTVSVLKMFSPSKEMIRTIPIDTLLDEECLEEETDIPCNGKVEIEVMTKHGKATLEFTHERAGGQDAEG